MSRLRILVFLSCLLLASAGCGSEEGDGLSGNTSSPRPAANGAPPQQQAATGPKLNDQEGALMIGAARGDVEMVKAALDQGVKVDTRDPDGNATALCHAAWFGRIDTARLLIERGADVNAKKSDGTSVLRLATMRGHNELAEILKKAGAQ